MQKKYTHTNRLEISNQYNMQLRTRQIPSIENNLNKMKDLELNDTNRCDNNKIIEDRRTVLQSVLAVLMTVLTLLMGVSVLYFGISCAFNK